MVAAHARRSNDEPLWIQLTYQGFLAELLLAELLLAEVDDRDRRSSIRRVRAAGFPRDKWLGDFEFDAKTAINPATVHELAKGDWIRKGDPLCLIGDSGTGKSHLLIALGTAVVRSRPPGSVHAGHEIGASWSRPPTKRSSSRPSPATVASTCSCSTNSAI